MKLSLLNDKSEKKLVLKSYKQHLFESFCDVLFIVFYFSFKNKIKYIYGVGLFLEIKLIILKYIMIFIIFIFDKKDDKKDDKND